MKRLLTISFMVFYGLFATQLTELLKIPVLVVHYWEHRAGDSRMSFVQFLLQHYTSADDHDGDTEKDSRLPFKSLNHSLAYPATKPPQPYSCVQESELRLYFEKQALMPGADFLIPSFCSNIWRPPKSINTHV